MFDSTWLINAGDIMTLNNYSDYLSLRNEHLDKAEKMISTALSADPNNSTFWILTLGSCLKVKIILWLNFICVQLLRTRRTQVEFYMNTMEIFYS